MSPDLRRVREQLERRWHAEGWHRDETLGALLADAADRHGVVRLTFHSRTRGTAVLTLADMYARGQRVAAGMRALGLTRGDVVAVQLPNWPELAISYAAAAALGLVIVPVVPIYGAAEIG